MVVTSHSLELLSRKFSCNFIIFLLCITTNTFYLFPLSCCLLNLEDWELVVFFRVYEILLIRRQKCCAIIHKSYILILYLVTSCMFQYYGRYYFITHTFPTKGSYLMYISNVTALCANFVLLSSQLNGREYSCASMLKVFSFCWIVVRKLIDKIFYYRWFMVF